MEIMDLLKESELSPEKDVRPSFGLEECSPMDFYGSADRRLTVYS